MSETGTFKAGAYKPLITELSGWIEQLHDADAISDLEHSRLISLVEKLRRQYINYVQWFGFEQMEVQRLGNEYKYWYRKAEAKYKKMQQVIDDYSQEVYDLQEKLGGLEDRMRDIECAECEKSLLDCECE